MTRGRGKNIAIILDPTGTADPEEALAEAIAKVPNALTAHAYRDRLYRSKGVEPPVSPTQLEPVEPAATAELPIDLVEDDVERARRLFDAYAEEHSTPSASGADCDPAKDSEIPPREPPGFAAYWEYE